MSISEEQVLKFHDGVAYENKLRGQAVLTVSAAQMGLQARVPEVRSAALPLQMPEAVGWIFRRFTDDVSAGRTVAFSEVWEEIRNVLIEGRVLSNGQHASYCVHANATFTIGPTTDQRNWRCQHCNSVWTTYPTDEERRAATGIKGARI